MNRGFLRVACTLAGLSAVALLSSACTGASSCSRGEDDVTVQASPDRTTNGVYYSAPYGGPYQEFHGGRTIHFLHGLGKRPFPPVFWLAFSDSGTLAQAAGNEAELVALDDQQIAVKNDTCSKLYIWFYTQAPP